MNMFLNQKLYLFLVIGLAVSPPVIADNLGRLFTTQGERIKLEKIRNAKEEPKKVEVVKIEDIIDKVEKKEEKKIVLDTISLKGLVHRSDGKNTAWINDSNTFEGDLESQYIQVEDTGITQDHVQLVMPDKTTKIELKVGDNYIPQDY